MGKKYFKITNIDETHNGYAYRDGLNVLDKPFQPEGSCVPGGLYFTTIEFIPNFYPYGVYLREVILPKKDPDFQMVGDPMGDKFRANKIILGHRYSLFDPQTYKKFKLDMSKNKFIVGFASKYGRIDFLNWFKKSGMNLHYSEHAIDMASEAGQISVLDWWLNNSSLPKQGTGTSIWNHYGLLFLYSKDAIDWASANGRIDVLDWWLKSGLLLKYSEKAMDDASRNGLVNVLEWWFRNRTIGDTSFTDPLGVKINSRLELKYTADAIVNASRNGQIDALNWWRLSGLEMKYTCNVVELARGRGLTEVAKWWESWNELQEHCVSILDPSAGVKAGSSNIIVV